jgi:prepilin-type processing-associated H-X9-DG protein
LQPADYAFCFGNYQNNSTTTGAVTTMGNYSNGQTTNGLGVFLRYGWSARMRDVTDGTSNTFAIGECIGAWCGWQAGWGFEVFATTAYPPDYLNSSLMNAANTGNADACIGFRSRHIGGCHFVFVDGSVHFISDNINGPTYCALASRASGEVVGDY